MSTQEMEHQYLVLDSRDHPLARAVLESNRDAPSWQFEILEDGIDRVMTHEQLKFLPLADDQPALLGRVLHSGGDRVYVEKLQRLDSELRQNLRMPVSFQTLLYPVTGAWTGRRWVEANDLSCGGIAFFCREALEAREQAEIVIPITSQPLVLRCEILRRRPSNRVDEIMYAAKFTDLCHEEEMLVREAVFSVQVSARAR